MDMVANTEWALLGIASELVGMGLPLSPVISVLVRLKALSEKLSGGTQNHATLVSHGCQLGLLSTLSAGGDKAHTLALLSGILGAAHGGQGCPAAQQMLMFCALDAAVMQLDTASRTQGARLLGLLHQSQENGLPLQLRELDVRCNARMRGDMAIIQVAENHLASLLREKGVSTLPGGGSGQGVLAGQWLAALGSAMKSCAADDEVCGLSSLSSDGARQLTCVCLHAAPSDCFLQRAVDSASDQGRSAQGLPARLPSIAHRLGSAC